MQRSESASQDLPLDEPSLLSALAKSYGSVIASEMCKFPQELGVGTENLKTNADVQFQTPGGQT